MKALSSYLTAVLIISGCSSLENLKLNLEGRIFHDPEEIYIVQSGDSIWSIAFKNNLDPQNIINSNNLSSPYVIFPNQELSLFNTSLNSIYKATQKNISWNQPIKTSKKPTAEGQYWLIYKEDRGEKIYAVERGKVVVSGPDIPGYGNLVMISHPDGFISLYAHCEKIYVSSGDIIESGMEIAQLGSSEASSPMLKFQLRKNGAPVKTSTISFR
jgi:murein DD-endopeptidase MepM/ murein hydrolase activator NlpD